MFNKSNLFTLFLVAASCCVLTSRAQSPGSNAQPHDLVYKTMKRYYRLVPVQLSDDRKTVVSYPDPADLGTGGSEQELPVPLHKGYYLDRRGIGRNTAFIRLTYEQYAKLQRAPSPDELNKMIVDKKPITQLYDCGVRGTYTVQQLNKMIDNGTLGKKCRVVR